MIANKTKDTGSAKDITNCTVLAQSLEEVKDRQKYQISGHLTDISQNDFKELK